MCRHDGKKTKQTGPVEIARQLEVQYIFFFKKGQTFTLRVKLLQLADRNKRHEYTYREKCAAVQCSLEKFIRTEYRRAIYLQIVITTLASTVNEQQQHIFDAESLWCTGQITKFYQHEEELISIITCSSIRLFLYVYMITVLSCSCE